MDVTTALTKLEAALEEQLLLAGRDDAVAAAGELLVGALRPAISTLALDLAQQAATEIDAQLPTHTVEVVLRDGEPHLTVRAEGPPAPPPPPDDVEARLTLRLPESLKRLVEEEASTAGDSINSWVVDTLSARAHTKPPRRGGASGEFHT